MLKPQVVILAILGLTVIAPLRWRQCVLLMLMLMVFEGALRKWVFPGASQLLYFGKDALLIAAYLKFAVSKEPRQSYVETPPALRFLMMTSTIICLLEVCNFNLGSPLLGLFGARNYLLYIPLIFLMQHLFASQNELDKFLRWHVVLSVPIFFLALAQFFSPPESAINTYAWGEEGPQQSLSGTAVRVTGTFSYIAGYSSYLQVCACLVVPLLITEHPPRWRWAFRVSLVLLVFGMFMNGSRGSVIGFVLFVLGFFLLNRVFRQLRLYTRFIAPVILLLLAMIFWFTPQLNSFMARASHNEDIIPRIVSSFTSPVRYIGQAGAAGYGVGATYQAAGIIRSAFGLPQGTKIPVYFEGEPERVMLEIGPIGFIAWYALRIFLIVQLWRTFQKLKVPLLRELALTACLIHLISLPGLMVFQITFMVYYWFLAGFILLLPQLEHLENLRWQESQKE